MILFYSIQCKHCNILLDAISKHDKNNVIKTISIDTMINNNYDINKIIHSVPALVIPKENKINNEEILYGKQVFDYLLLPNRGALFNQDNNTRLNKETKDSQENTVFNEITENENEPSAFTLGSTMSDKFSSLDEKSDNLLKDKNYSWDLLTNPENNIENKDFDIASTALNPVSSVNDKGDKQLPSLEELMNKRMKDII
jgi:hypothetical protein|tara:strand:- start:1795 stop:2391 length:597 start_codon:yes stop_codon:yes gene_type:complete